MSKQWPLEYISTFKLAAVVIMEAEACLNTIGLIYAKNTLRNASGSTFLLVNVLNLSKLLCCQQIKYSNF